MALRLRRGTDTERQLITPLEGELIYTTDSKELWVGDSTTPGGLRVTGEIPQSISDLADVNTSFGIDVNDFLTWDGGNFIPNDAFGIINNKSFQLNIEDGASNPVVDFASSTHYGTFIGDLQGDVVGSVFADDSTIIINGLDKTIGLGDFTTDITIEKNNDRSEIRLRRVEIGDISGSPTSVQLGGVSFQAEDDAGNRTISRIFSTQDALLGYHITDSNYTDFSKYFILTNGNFGIGNIAPTEKLDVTGNANITGTLVAASLQGTLTLDDSTIVIDGINGSIVAPSYVQFGSFTTAERDAITAANGMVIYNTTTDKFNGYQNGAWINIDDGSTA